MSFSAKDDTKEKEVEANNFQTPSASELIEPTDHHDHHFNYSRLLEQLNPVQIATSAIAFFKQVPHFLWTFFIEAFLIPTYRPEWCSYSTWQAISDSDEETTTAKVRSLRKCRRKSARKKKKTIKLASTIPKAVKHNHAQCEIITINVSGKIYNTTLRTLSYFPDTLLGDTRRRQKLYDPNRNDYFIDRSRSCFDAILYYYQSRGILRRPNTVSLDMFEDEIRFYELGHDVVDKLRREEGIMMDIEKPVPRKLLPRKYWLLFEYPESSMQARLVAVLSIVVVIISTVLFCLETLWSFQRRATDVDSLLPATEVTLADPFYFTETACIAWFVFEFVIRCLSAPRKTVFFKSMSNIIDLLAILPYFVALFLSQQDSGNRSANKTTSLTVFRVIRLVRVFRILKLSRHNRGLKVLGKTLRASIRELALLMFFLAIGVVLFSSAVYFTEIQHPRTHFQSIIDAFWWSVITMTTCGYGDDVPLTVMGRIVGAFCAISGVLTLALPVPVIVSNFNNFYAREDDSVVAHVESDHVAQCPCRSGWYGVDGSVLSNTNEQIAFANLNFKMLSWVSGENKPDESDSDFESLKHIDYESNSGLRKRIKRLTHDMAAVNNIFLHEEQENQKEVTKHKK